MGKRVELLAPAGSREAFYGAIHAGADAVYLGGAKFGARAYAENFSREELAECIRYAHLWGRRVYLTVNTLVRESEFGELYEAIAPYYQGGLDGVIVQDLGVFLYIKEKFPDLALHVSTQMTMTGPYGARLLAELGAARIVPARELNLEEIRAMKEACGLELETFVHGAMCYCYSGQCLFSSILGGRSGNRGRCAQPCRLPYSVSVNGRSSGECYPLSLKDLCVIDRLPALIDAGIDSFKIEGRMKRPEYVAGVTAVYRKYIDRYYERQDELARDSGCALKPGAEKRDRELLSGLYVRGGLQDGYYFRRNGREMITLDSPAYRGTDETLLLEIRRRCLERRPEKRIAVRASVRIGLPAEVTLICGELSVTVRGAEVQAAQKQPVTRENVERQLSKLGDSIFCAGQVDVELDEGAFLPLRELNELRRQAVLRLEDAVIETAGLGTGRQAVGKGPAADMAPKSCAFTNNGGPVLAPKPALHISVRTPDQLDALLRLALEKLPVPVSRFYLDADLFAGRETAAALEVLRPLSQTAECFLALPYILRRSDGAYLKKSGELLTEGAERDILRGCMARSLEGWAFLEQSGYRGKITADSGIYVWNLRTLAFWRDKLESFCLPLELNARDQRILWEQSDLPAEKLIYGRIPMMLTANCLAKTMESREVFPVFLKDRLGKAFPVEINCTHCMNIIYNTVPLSLHRECARTAECVRPRLDFTTETGPETLEIIRYFSTALSGQDAGKPPFGEYTTGHEKRGAE